MNTDSESFNRSLGASQKLQSRWDAVASKLEGDLKAHGYNLPDPNILKDVPGIRLAVLTDMGLQSDYLEEVLRHPLLQEQVKAQQTKQKIAAGDEETLAAISRLRPAERLNIGRAMAAEKAKTATRPTMTASEEAQKIALLMKLPPQQRLSVGRSWGLIT